MAFPAAVHSDAAGYEPDPLWATVAAGAAQQEDVHSDAAGYGVGVAADEEEL